jgi:hypothetical protein
VRWKLLPGDSALITAAEFFYPIVEISSENFFIELLRIFVMPLAMV